MLGATIFKFACVSAMQVGAHSSSIGRSPRLALQGISNVTTCHANHASPRSMSRQSAFLGQPAASPPEGWNASINPQSPGRFQEQSVSRPTTAAVAAVPATTPRNAAVVRKAVGFSKPKMPLLSLAGLQADKRQLGMQMSHRKV